MKLGKTVKGVFFFFIAVLAVFLVIVLPIHYYLLVPDIQIVSAGQIELAVSSEYTLDSIEWRPAIQLTSRPFWNYREHP